MAFSRLLVACLVCAALVACERARPVYVPEVVAKVDTSPIWIGELGSWSGREARDGWAEHRGFELAVETINAQGGVRGRPLRVHAYDDRGRVEGASAAGRRLAHDDKAVLIVGGTTRALAEAAAAAAGDVPLVSGAAPVDAAEGVVGIDAGAKARADLLAAHAKSSGLARVTLLVRPQVAGDREQADALAASLRERGIASDERAISAETIQPVIAALAADPPPAVFVACVGSDAALLCGALARGGVRARVLVAGAPDPTTLPEDQRSALDGVTAASAFDPDARGGPCADFAAAWKARFDEPLNARGFLGYAAGLRAIAALTLAKEYWPADVRAALSATDTAAIRPVLVRIEHGLLQRADAPKD